jgi:hypothetical protein
MDAAALKNFRDASAPAGIVWSWGCTFLRARHIVLSRLFTDQHVAKHSPQKIKDTDSFKPDFP